MANLITTGLAGFGLLPPSILAPIRSFLTVFSQSAQFQLPPTEESHCFLDGVCSASTLVPIQAVVVGLNWDRWITRGGWICWSGFLPFPVSQRKGTTMPHTQHPSSQHLVNTHMPAHVSSLSITSTASSCPSHASARCYTEGCDWGGLSPSLSSRSSVPHG